MTITSAKTSINKDKVPALFNIVEEKLGWQKRSTHLDYGCGSWPEIIAKFFKRFNTLYIPYDPYNRTEKQNKQSFEKIDELFGGVDTASLSNVLNVIRYKTHRREALKTIWGKLRLGGILYITVYEGNRSGIGRKSQDDCWQTNMKTQDYVQEIEKVFGRGNVERKGKLIIATR